MSTLNISPAWSLAVDDKFDKEESRKASQKSPWQSGDDDVDEESKPIDAGC